MSGVYCFPLIYSISFVVQRWLVNTLNVKKKMRFAICLVVRTDIIYSITRKRCARIFAGLSLLALGQSAIISKR